MLALASSHIIARGGVGLNGSIMATRILASIDNRSLLEAVTLVIQEAERRGPTRPALAVGVAVKQ